MAEQVGCRRIHLSILPPAFQGSPPVHSYTVRRHGGGKSSLDAAVEIPVSDDPEWRNLANFAQKKPFRHEGVHHWTDPDAEPRKLYRYAVEAWSTHPVPGGEGARTQAVGRCLGDRGSAAGNAAAEIALPVLNGLLWFKSGLKRIPVVGPATAMAVGPAVKAFEVFVEGW